LAKADDFEELPSERVRRHEKNWAVIIVGQHSPGAGQSSMVGGAGRRSSLTSGLSLAATSSTLRSWSNKTAVMIVSDTPSAAAHRIDASSSVIPYGFGMPEI
jgi:hypothetical protein